MQVVRRGTALTALIAVAGVFFGACDDWPTAGGILADTASQPSAVYVTLCEGESVASVQIVDVSSGDVLWRADAAGPPRSVFAFDFVEPPDGFTYSIPWSEEQAGNTESVRLEVSLVVDGKQSSGRARIELSKLRAGKILAESTVVEVREWEQFAEKECESDGGLFG